MGVTSPPGCSVLSSPFSSPNVAALLKIKILSWSQETGFPVCIRVRVADRTFNLHKLPLTCKSGYFREKLKEVDEVQLPPDFPGGADTFEMIALFIYGSTTLVDPFNVAALRCAAEFLQMTGGTCERFDIYLNQVVLQSWNDTLIVLQNCQTLLPWAEDLLIVSRCIETLAFMACMEILDPERRRDHPVLTLEALSCRLWTDQMVKDIITHELWINDLIALPLVFFKRVIGSLRRQGMKEKYVTPIVLFYAHRWVIVRENSEEHLRLHVLQGVIDLLPVATKTIPVGFYFCLLSSSIELSVRDDSVEKLQNQIASMLHLAQLKYLDDLPSDGIETSVMETIFLRYFSYNMQDSECSNHSSSVAELWDTYLNQIAHDPELSCKRFMNLIETVPISSRQTHDHLYRALTAFFKSHPHLSQEDKGLVCKYLNCRKLSQLVCIEAVQNELMPLRLIVEALFVQQLNTQQAFKECSGGSFRYANCGGQFSGSLSNATSKSQNLGDSPHINASGLLRKDSSVQSSSEIDYESTSFRIQNLEKEVMSLKRSLQLQHISKKIEKISGRNKSEPAGPEKQRHGNLVETRSMSKKKNLLQGQVAGCIGTVNFGLQRKYAQSILKILQRVRCFGRGRPKREPGAAATGM